MAVCLQQYLMNSFTTLDLVGTCHVLQHTVILVCEGLDYKRLVWLVTESMFVSVWACVLKSTNKISFWLVGYPNSHDALQSGRVQA